jgi:hypothetical protein
MEKETLVGVRVDQALTAGEWSTAVTAPKSNRLSPCIDTGTNA